MESKKTSEVSHIKVGEPQTSKRNYSLKKVQHQRMKMYQPPLSNCVRNTKTNDPAAINEVQSVVLSYNTNQNLATSPKKKKLKKEKNEDSWEDIFRSE